MTDHHRTAPALPASPAAERARTVGLVALAMVAFAANSLLCRAALATGEADAAGFTVVRLASGALTLWAILALRAGRTGGRPRAPWDAVTALSLCVYMVGFSAAYLALATGTGALILFGAVQATMLSTALARGERLGAPGWLGLALAAAGLVWLLLPGLDAPAPWAAMVMALAGVGWGVYSLRGRGAADPLAVSAGNFALASALVLPLAFLAAGLGLVVPDLTAAGLALALASGALASACGYVVWYAALPRITAGQAATVQLSVPVIAAAAGIALLGEALTWRLALAGVLVLGGVALALRRPARGRGSRGPVNRELWR
ncbi:MAG: DMT family transporter [Paracoccaceae bacterium]